MVCFEKILFVSVVSIPVRNNETNRNKPKKMFLGFAKQTDKQPKQIEFVSVRTGKKFDCFEDTLLTRLCWIWTVGITSTDPLEWLSRQQLKIFGICAGLGGVLKGTDSIRICPISALCCGSAVRPLPRQ